MNSKLTREQLEKMLTKCPEILTPTKARKFAPVGKNKLYDAVKNGEIESYIYKGGYIFTKDALIDYLIKTSTDKGHGFAVAGEKNEK